MINYIIINFSRSYTALRNISVSCVYNKTLIISRRSKNCPTGQNSYAYNVQQAVHLSDVIVYITRTFAQFRLAESSLMKNARYALWTPIAFVMVLLTTSKDVVDALCRHVCGRASGCR